MKRVVTYIGIGVAVFGMSFWLCKPLFRTIDVQDWFVAQSGLKVIHWEFYEAMRDSGEIPDEEKVNGFIRDVWHAAEAGDYEKLGHFEELYWQLLWKDFQAVREWGQIPKYVVDPNLLQGFGFYLEGEDGVSASKGNDPDDLNSWDYRSDAYYHEKLHDWRKNRDLILSAIVATVVVFLLFLMGRLEYKKDAT